MFAQWVNSYKRLVPGFEAPVYVAWSRRNRSALIRIPLYKPGAEPATRAEIRFRRCLQSLFDVRGVAARRARGNRAGLRAGGPDGDELLPPDRRAAEGTWDRLAPETLGEAIDELAQFRADAEGARPPHLRQLRPAKAREWDEYRAELTEWELTKYLRLVRQVAGVGERRENRGRSVSLRPAGSN